MNNPNAVYQINSSDNVGVALTKLSAGDRCVVLDPEKQSIAKLILNEDVPFGFKVALRDIGAGRAIIKYGEEIGSASANIKRGEMVHINNLVCDRGYSKREQ